MSEPWSFESILAGLIAWGLPLSSLAGPVVPAQQSGCEIEANKYASQHKHSLPDAFMKSRFDPFWGTLPPGPPSSYRDPESRVTFYVESDGRHLAAIDGRGNLLWARNPFVDSGLCPYRSAHPYISWIGSPGGTFGRHYLGPSSPPPMRPRTRES